MELKAPPSAGRVARKRQERRERIVEAAAAAIAEHGPEAFSLNQLARELDYTPGALYWYFPSKEALVVEVQAVVLRQLAADVAQARPLWKSEPVLGGHTEQVRALHVLLRQSQHYLRLRQANPLQWRIVAFSLDPRIWLTAPEQEAELRPVLEEMVRVSAAGFVEAEQVGALEPGSAAHRAIQYWANNQGMLQTAKLARFDPDLFDAERLGLDASCALLRGWGAAREAVALARELVDGTTAPAPRR